MSPPHEPRLNVSGSNALLARASSEFLQIVIVRRQNERRARRRLSPVADELLPIALHRPIEIVEFGVLAEARRIGLSGIGVGLRLDDLRLFAALRQDRLRFLLARRAH